MKTKNFEMTNSKFEINWFKENKFDKMAIEGK